MLTHKPFLMIALLFSLLCVIPFASAQDAQPQYGGSLTIATTDDFSTLDPVLTLTGSDIIFMPAIYDTLVRINYNDPTLPLVPHLAESYEVSEDGLTWTIKVKEGVFFHHGKELTADDVVYTFQRAKDPNISVVADQLGDIEAIERVDNYTVQFKLNQPNFLFIERLTVWPYSIVPSDRTEEQIANEPSGTGAFMLQEFSASEKVTVIKNENYWMEGLPYLHEIIFRVIPDRKTQIAALVSGEVDVVSQVGALDLPILNTQPTIVVEQSAPTNASPVLVMNTTVAPFDDVRVVQAMKKVLDRQALSNLIEGGLAVPSADHLVPPTHPFNAQIAVPQQDIEGARALLAEAGYPDGIDVTLSTSGAVTGAIEMAVALQEMAAPAGINLTLERVEPSAYWSSYYMQTPFFITFWPTSPVSATLKIVYLSTSPYNESSCCGELLDAMVVAVTSSATTEAQATAYAELQQFVNENDGHIIPYFSPHLTAKRDVVFGEQITFNPMFETNWVQR